MQMVEPEEILVIIMGELLFLTFWIFDPDLSIIKDSSTPNLLLFMSSQIAIILLMYFIIFWKPKRIITNVSNIDVSYYLKLIYNNKKITYQSGLTFNRVFFGILLIIASTGLIFMINEYYLESLIKKDLFNIVMGGILNIIIPMIPISWSIWELWPRTLILNKRGIKFYIGKKLKFQLGWNEIYHITPVFREYITIYIKNNQPEFFFKINHIPEKQLKNAFAIMNYQLKDKENEIKKPMANNLEKPNLILDMSFNNGDVPVIYLVNQSDVKTVDISGKIIHFPTRWKEYFSIDELGPNQRKEIQSFFQTDIKRKKKINLLMAKIQFKDINGFVFEQSRTININDLIKLRSKIKMNGIL